MTSLNSNAYRLSVLAAGVIGFLGAELPAASAQQQQIPQGWFKACTKQEDVDICNVQNIVTAGNGQLVT
ncbi:MAG: invasion associated locus B family protein, partial [Mesorhizobium sp.]